MGYYNFLNSKPSETALRHEYLTEQIKRMFKQHKARYGSPRVALQLYAEGIETNKRVLAMLMQRAGLISVYSRERSRKQPNHLKEGVLHENILNRNFFTLQPNAVFVTDITYVNCSDGMLYLTIYMDLASRPPKAYSVIKVASIVAMKWLHYVLNMDYDSQ